MDGASICDVAFAHWAVKEDILPMRRIEVFDGINSAPPRSEGSIGQRWILSDALSRSGPDKPKPPPIASCL